MNEGKEDPVVAAPNLVKDDLPTPTPMDTQDGNVPANHVDEKEKIRPNYDERRTGLLNNPTYGVILGFLDKFRTHIDIQDYPLRLLKENLLSEEQNISRRLIDFHLTLLKRISLGKSAHRDKFVPMIIKFAYRFDYGDGEYLKTNGYSQAEIDIKLRILKNLLETQFDHNQTFKSALLEKSSFEVRSQPFGRDRSGTSYWLFMDSECFVLLFRETVDDDRTWINIAKDKDELESAIKLLITNNVVRKKFPEWKFAHEPFNALEASNEFQERYMPAPIVVKEEEPRPEPEVKPSKRSVSLAAPVKTEKKVPSTPTKAPSPPPIKAEVQSDEESSNSAEKSSQRSHAVSFEDTNSNVPAQEINNNQEDQQLKSSAKKSRRRKYKGWNKKKRRTVFNTLKKEEPIPEIKTPTRGRKRKQIIHTDEEQIVAKKNEQTTSQKRDITPILIDEEVLNEDNLPIALRRSKRTRKVPTNEPSPATSSATKSAPQTPSKKKLPNGKCKPSSQTPVKSSHSSKTKKGRKGCRRRRGKASTNGASSSSDEHPPSDEEEKEENEYNFDDYLPDKKQLEELDGDDLYEGKEDYTPRRLAKTVAKRRGQMNEDLQSSSSACCVCVFENRSTRSIITMR